jgi:threonine/homoserine/homoserine lactone efflux protein
MPGIHDYWLFLLSGILLNLTPGQDTFFILGNSLGGGRRAGIASALGIAAGSVVHTLAAALGLSAILATSSTAFAAVKLLGAAYLLYIGVRALTSRSLVPGNLDASAARAARVAFRRGIVTNVLNPKVALFFLAFLPQFIDPASDRKVEAFLLLGATFITTGLAWCLVLAVAAAGFRELLLARPAAGSVLSRTAGAIFIALGLRLALGGNLRIAAE